MLLKTWNYISVTSCYNHSVSSRGKGKAAKWNANIFLKLKLCSIRKIVSILGCFKVYGKLRWSGREIKVG